MICSVCKYGNYRRTWHSSALLTWRGVGRRSRQRVPSAQSKVQQDPWGPSSSEEVGYQVPGKQSQWTPAEASLNNSAGEDPRSPVGLGSSLVVGSKWSSSEKGCVAP